MSDHSILFAEGRLGNMALKNRLLMAPMGNNFGSAEHVISEQQTAYYERRAQGGVGLIITESCPVEIRGMHGRNRIQIYRDNALAELTRFTQRIHRHQCRIALQLTHGGSKSSPELIGEYPLAPSSIVLVRKDFIPRRLSIDEIEEITDKFAQSALLAQQAGFDGVGILAASGHLVHQFLSSASNQRDDRYGGSMENRLRFLLEVVGRIKQAHGR